MTGDVNLTHIRDALLFWLSASLRNPDGASSSAAWTTWEAMMRPRLHRALAATPPAEWCPTCGTTPCPDCQPAEEEEA